MIECLKPEATYNLVTHDWKRGKSFAVGTPRIISALDSESSAVFWFTSTFTEAFKRGEYEIREGREGRFTHVRFYCVDCPQASGLKRVVYEYAGGTGYATLPDNGGRLCYQCAAMRNVAEAKKCGKAIFYLYSDSFGKPIDVGDWTGVIKMPVTHYLRNGKKLVVWFRLDGEEWRGINNGNDDLVKAGKKWRL